MAAACKAISSYGMGPRPIDRDRVRKTSQIVMEMVRSYNLEQTPDFETGNKIFLVALLKTKVELPLEITPTIKNLNNLFNQLSVEQQSHCIQILLRNGLRSDILREDEFLWRCEQALHLLSNHDFIFIRR
jgi:hypothetical protein